MKCTHTSQVIRALYNAMIRTGDLERDKSVRYYVQPLKQGIEDLLLCTDLQNARNSISLSLSFLT